MKARASLAASFVATVALAGCSSPQARPPEYPPPPVTETRNPPAPDPEEPPPETTLPEADEPPLQQASPDENITKRDDGTCWVQEEIDCPPSPMTCNPPAPRKVACPVEAP